MPTNPPPSDDTPKRRPRGDMYLRAEQRHLADVTPAPVLETMTPVTSNPSGTRVPDGGPPAASFGSERIVERSAQVAPPHAPAVSAVRNPAVNPLASFRSETQADLHLVKPTAIVKPLAPPQPTRTAVRMTRDQRALLPIAALVTIAVGALIAIAFTLLWSRGGGDAPAAAESTVASSEGAVEPGPAPAPLVPAPRPALPAASRPSAATAPATAAAASVIPAARTVNQQAARSTPASAAARNTAAVAAASVGQLRITSNPNGARVTINGIGWGQTPVTVRNLPLGTKTVRLTSDGYASQQRTVELSSGGASAAVHMALTRLRTR